MSIGCRDCRTCAAPGVAKAGRALGAGTVHLCTAGMSWVAVRAFASLCPQCRHLASRHQRRADGSFID
jgi:hypothetical protein